MVYRDVSMYTEGAVHDARPNPIYCVSVDEKPGVQAIGLMALDLPPVPGKASTFSRDYEYVRRGTVSILAGIDLHSEGESSSVVNGGAAQAEVFSNFIGTSMCQGVNARDRR